MHNSSLACEQQESRALNTGALRARPTSRPGRLSGGGGGRQATSSQRSLPNLQNSSWFHVGRNYSLSVRNTSSLLLTGLHKAKDKEADATDLLLRGGRGTKAKRPSLLCLFLWKGVRLLLRRGSEPKMLTCEENAGLHSVAKTANR